MLSTVIAGSKIVSGSSVAKEFAPQPGQQQAEEQRTVTRFGGGRKKPVWAGEQGVSLIRKQVRADFLKAWAELSII